MPKLVNNRVTAEYYIVKDPATIGRHESNDVVLPAPAISRFHLELGSHDNSFYVQDLNSTYGTYVNERRLTERVTIADGDRLQLGICPSNPEGAFDLTFIAEQVPRRASAIVKTTVAERESIRGGRWTDEEVDHILIVKLYGHLRQPACDTMMDAICEKARSRMCDVVLDFEDVDHLNSHALGYLLHFRTELLRIGKHMTIANPNALVHTLLDTLGLTSVIGCYSPVQRAIEVVLEFRRLVAKHETREFSPRSVTQPRGDEERVP